MVHVGFGEIEAVGSGEGDGSGVGLGFVDGVGVGVGVTIEGDGVGMTPIAAVEHAASSKVGRSQATRRRRERSRMRFMTSPSFGPATEPAPPCNSPVTIHDLLGGAP
jgi:hypothetical protein